MIDNDGVVIRLTWNLYSSNVVMTEWVPLLPPPNATLVLMPASISENAGVSTVTATLDRTTSAATTITVSAAAVAPAVPGDFALSSTRTLTIAAGATTSTGTVTVTASDNDVYALDKSVTVSGMETGEVVEDPPDVTLTIADDDDAPTLSIDSPSVTEGDSGTATLTFTVTLSRASARTVTVGYADAGTGTATSGTDYTAIPAGTLTFAAGTTSQPIAVTVTGDATGEADETVVVQLSGPVNATLAAASGTGTIADDDAALRVRLKGINEALLPDLSRAMTASTMDAVTGRIGQALSPDGAAAHGAMAPADVLTGFAGLLQANEQALEDGTWSWKQGLAGRRFALALSGDGPATGAGARVTAWGAGDYRSLSDGEGSAVDWDGHLFGAHLGMDARFGAGGLAGLALSVSKGRFDYTDTSAEALGTVKGEYESRMTSAHPYVGWAWPAGTHAWASLGYGRGDVTLTDGEAGRHTSDSTLRSAAAGGSVRVLSGEGPGVFGPVTVDLKGEAWTTRLAVEDNGERIAGLAVRTHRLRVAAEGARAFALGGGAAFTPSVELGMRFDGGDGETGAGVELGGGLDYAHPALGLSADVAGRVLLAHEGATEDWSVGGAVRLEPASGLGPSLRLAPSYGDTGSGLSRLWEGAGAGSGAGATGASPTTRLDTEMGYGLAAFAGVLTPYGGLGLSEGGARGYRLGARFLHGPAFELDLEGERRESRTERAGHGLMLRGRMRW